PRSTPFPYTTLFRSPCRAWQPSVLTPRGVVEVLLAAQLELERTRLALVPQGLHLRVVGLAVDDGDVEQHRRVPCAAQLGTLARVDPLTLGDDLELVRVPGDHVLLVEERRYPERVDDVARVEDDLDPFADGQVEGR